MLLKRRNLALFLLGLVGLFCLSVVFTVGFGIGVWQGKQQSTLTDFLVKDTQVDATTDTAALDTNLFWDVWHEVKDQYVDQPVDDATLFYGAIAGIAQSVGDPYTLYLSPEDAKKFNEVLSGEFEGIGAEIGDKDGQIVVIAPLAGTPAEKAGLFAGDIIVKIDGLDTNGMTVDEAITHIRGPKDTSVTLKIYRAGEVDFRDIIIVRDTIQLETVTYRVEERDGKRIGVISLNSIDQGSNQAFTEITHKILLDMPDSLILDVRNNPGGLLDEAIAISSHFIEDGIVVQERYSEDHIEKYEALGDATLADGPKLIVLVNDGSASAAEIIAGALQDNGRATLLGQTTFGKGSVQNYKSFPDGSSLKITVARWLTPNGRSIDHEGITPDLVVEWPRADYDAGVDTQLEAAIKELNR